MVKSRFALAMGSRSKTLSSDSPDQLHRTCGRAHLAFMDDIGKDVARRLFCDHLVNARQVGRFTALSPKPEAAGPGIQLFRWVAGLDLIIALLQAGVNEVADHVRNCWIGAVFGEHDRRFELP